MADAAAEAKAFMTSLRVLEPALSIGLSSYRFPSLHSELPWSAFRAKCDFDMPQVYFEQSHNPQAQLSQSFQEFAKLTPALPYVPTFPMYKNGGWAPTLADITNFLNETVTLGLAAVNCWDWFQGKRDLPDQWQLYGKCSLDATPEPVESKSGLYMKCVRFVNIRAEATQLSADVGDVQVGQSVGPIVGIAGWQDRGLGAFGRWHLCLCC